VPITDKNTPFTRQILPAVFEMKTIPFEEVFSMAVVVNQVTQEGEIWMADLSIHYGVYRREHYPVRLVDVPRAPEGWTEDRQRQRIAQFVTEQVMTHMRKGSLPPRGVQIHAPALWQDPSADHSLASPAS